MVLRDQVKFGVNSVEQWHELLRRELIRKGGKVNDIGENNRGVGDVIDFFGHCI